MIQRIAGRKPFSIQQDLGGQSYWSGGVDGTRASSPKAFLMPVYDDYFLSYKDRSQEGVRVSLEKILSTDNFQFILIDGQIVGIWRRAIKGSAVTISVRGLTRLSLDERQAIRKAAQNNGGFLGLTTHIKFHS